MLNENLIKPEENSTSELNVTDNWDAALVKIEQDDCLFIKQQPVDDQNETFLTKSKNILKEDAIKTEQVEGVCIRQKPMDDQIKSARHFQCDVSTEHDIDNGLYIKQDHVDNQNEIFTIKENILQSDNSPSEEPGYSEARDFSLQQNIKERDGSSEKSHTLGNVHLDIESEYIENRDTDYCKAVKGGHLNTHMMTQTGGNPCKCDTCGKTYTRPRRNI